MTVFSYTVIDTKFAPAAMTGVVGSAPIALTGVGIAALQASLRTDARNRGVHITLSLTGSRLR